jgi:hypothetical protein
MQVEPLNYRSCGIPATEDSGQIMRLQQGKQLSGDEKKEGRSNGRLMFGGIYSFFDHLNTVHRFYGHISTEAFIISSDTFSGV